MEAAPTGPTEGDWCAAADEAWGHEDQQAFRRSVHAFIRDLVTAAEGTGQPITPHDIEARVSSVYYGEPVHHQLGHDEFRDLISEVGGVALVSSPDGEIVRLAETASPRGMVTPSRPADAPPPIVAEPAPTDEPRPSPAPAMPKSPPIVVAEVNLDNLRELATSFVQGHLFAAGTKGLPTSEIAALLSRRFLNMTVHNRLGFAELREFLATVPDILVRTEGGQEVATWTDRSPRPAPATAPPAILLTDEERDEFRVMVVETLFGLIDQCRSEGRECLMTSVGQCLFEHFPGIGKVHRALGYERLLDLLKSVDGIEVVNLSPGKDLVRRLAPHGP